MRLLLETAGYYVNNPSENGGELQIVNALTIHQQLKTNAPDALKCLEKAFTRDVVTPGKEATMENLLLNKFPIFSFSSKTGNIELRYMRYWIERGQKRAGHPLDQKTLSALDALDALLTAPNNVVSFRMQPGDIIWLNNKTIAHNRTAYKDSETNIRKLQRMWIDTSKQALH